VFVSGAAAGIGLATAELFARSGWIVGIYDRDVAGAIAARDRLRIATSSDRIAAGALDVTQPEHWERALAEFASFAGGSLDVLVNNAGVLAAGNFESIDIARHRQIVETNVFGTIAGAYAALPYLRAAAGSRVINLASASAIYGQPDIATYSASKFAVRGFTEALQIEWRRYDIAVRAIWPIFVKTAMVADNPGMRAIERLGVRLGPEDVAAAIARVVALPQSDRRTHFPVGAQARLAMLLARITPSTWTQTINAKLAGR
jgi:NAD(P)-dependent dehydrogenase (short-subunit alcohol dehydrogenase family)